ncbi:hypothetical protein FHX49_002568 [Microbacterium endophyticum]|uniref:DUF3071 domain-containing protein n=1 Tax=Microbacterium endophyticum TaxID=1526412 RepID=A0A7W4YPP1_9MICO|nr:septation protein SepH [Microbacterium endophyticum]MBB2976976.1 hypothetical protein [Microbacterium endophyticum]NIK36738.1 hypothetical protein [Microbacterium endophyticum]
MEQLRVIGNEDGKLILATESGERFSVPVDEVLRAEVRRSQRDRDPSSRAVRPSPRDIQAQIRSGLSTAEVAAVLGIELEDVVRYERPVLAEREFIVGQALSVPVLLGGDFDHDGPSTFGTAVRAKLAEAGATAERWSSWKDETGWIVKLEFAAAEVERDARWSFDPRRSTLAPLNTDATQLSRQGAMPEGLIPRLRALDVPGLKDESRFDSGAFGPRRTVEEADESTSPTGPVSQAHSAAQDAAIKRAPDAPSASSETADLLEALRRRRGQREPAPEPSNDELSPAPVALFDALEPGYEIDDQSEAPRSPDASAQGRPSVDSSRRKGRSSMPSWDEIVFGARTDE